MDNLYLHSSSIFCSVWNENYFFYPSGCFSPRSDETRRAEIPPLLGLSVGRAPPSVPACTTVYTTQTFKHNNTQDKHLNPDFVIYCSKKMRTIKLLTFLFYKLKLKINSYVSIIPCQERIYFRTTFQEKKTFEVLIFGHLLLQLIA